MKRAPLTVTVPLKTQTESNTGGHWRVKAERAAKQRSIAHNMCAPMLHRIRAGLRTGSLEGATVTLTRISPLRLDDDNLSSACKHVRDGIADALGIDDRDPRVRWLYSQRKGGAGERAVRVDVARGGAGS